MSSEQPTSETPLRLMLFRSPLGGWHVAPSGSSQDWTAETVEVMPVAEHKALRHAALALLREWEANGPAGYDLMWEKAEALRGAVGSRSWNQDQQPERRSASVPCSYCSTDGLSAYSVKCETSDGYRRCSACGLILQLPIRVLEDE